MRKICLLPLVCGLVFLAGCWDYNEMNMQEIVLVAAVDADDGINLTVKCAPREEREGMVYSSHGESFYDAVRELSERTDKKMYWGHISTIVIGEEAISSIDVIFDTLLRAEDVYLDVVPIIAREISAHDIAASGTDLTMSFANEDNSRRRRATKLWELFRERDEFGAFVVPCISKDKDGFKMSGALVRSADGARSMYLSGEEMLFLELITHESAGGYLPPIEVGGKGSASFEILSNRIEESDGGKTFLQRLILSPGEVRGNIGEEEMRLSTEEYLATEYAALISKTEKNGLEGVFRGKAKKFKVQVKISNAMGDG